MTLSPSLLATTPYGVAAAAVFLLLLVVAGVTDVRERRIPNVVVLALLAAGLLVSALLGGAAGAGWSLAAAGLGFIIWIPFYVFRMLGAGDVKLFAAAAAWLAPLQVVDAALVTAFIGGALSVFWIVRESGGAAGLVRILHAARYRQTLVQTERRHKLPYGVAMAIGLSLSFFGVGILS